MAAQTAILGHLGSESIAANTIATTAFNIQTVITVGVGQRISGHYRENDRREAHGRVRPYTKTFQVLFFGIGILTGALMFLLRRPVVGCTRLPARSAAMSREFLTVLAVTVVGTSYQVSCLCGIVRGGGDTRFVLFNDMIFMWGIVLPVSAVAAFLLHWPPVGVFTCLKTDQISKCTVAVVKVNRYSWIKRFDQAGSREITAPRLDFPVENW